MQNAPWSVVATVFAASTVFFFRAGPAASWATLLGAMVAALALCVGAFCAPVTVTSTAPDPDEYRRRKAWQFIAAGVVAVVTALVFGASSGMAAIAGIVAAMFVGAALPRHTVARDE